MVLPPPPSVGETLLIRKSRASLVAQIVTPFAEKDVVWSGPPSAAARQCRACCGHVEAFTGKGPRPRLLRGSRGEGAPHPGSPGPDPASVPPPIAQMGLQEPGPGASPLLLVPLLGRRARALAHIPRAEPRLRVVGAEEVGTLGGCLREPGEKTGPMPVALSN